MKVNHYVVLKMCSSCSSAKNGVGKGIDKSSGCAYFLSDMDDYLGYREGVVEGVEEAYCGTCENCPNYEVDDGYVESGDLSAFCQACKTTCEAEGAEDDSTIDIGEVIGCEVRRLTCSVLTALSTGFWFLVHC